MQKNRTSQDSNEDFHGSCYCGSCQFVCKSKPIFRTLCHCSICTRISGGLAFPCIGFSNNDFIMVKGLECLKGFKSSERLERFHCKICSSNVYNQSLVSNRLFRDTSLMNFRRDADGKIVRFDELKPDCHMFFKQCPSCYAELFKHDGLIKFDGLPH